MTIDFDAIGLHDLLLLEADGRHIEVAGRDHVEWTNSGWGEHALEVEILGTHKQPRTLRKSDAALILRHVRAAAIPNMVAITDSAQRVVSARNAKNNLGCSVYIDELADALKALNGEMK
jgi:hypothetical protein